MVVALSQVYPTVSKPARLHPDTLEIHWAAKPCKGSVLLKGRKTRLMRREKTSDWHGRRALPEMCVGTRKSTGHRPISMNAIEVRTRVILVRSSYSETEFGDLETCYDCVDSISMARLFMLIC